MRFQKSSRLGPSNLHELHANETAARNDIVQAQQKAYQECLRRLDNLVKLKTSPHNSDGSQLSDEEYGSQRAGLLKEKAGLEEVLGDVGNRVEQWLKLSEQTFEFACTARTRFAKGDADTKKEILAAIGSNLILKDKKLRIEARKPFFLLEKSLCHEEPENEPIEPENIGLSPRPNGEIATSRLRLLGDAQDVRTYGYKAERAAALIYSHFKREYGSRIGRRNG